ncbi:hypothetical protein ACGFJ5_28525 [Micromonospora echinaurantiaca]|uniref:hypothetical protein n=1 Tax=Micromonospora echinaurantiaca TaxID=47857 RepID=UPI00371CC238
MTDIHGPLARYAERMHTVIGDRHHVASPLGAWLLLALAGPATAGADRAELEDVLGTDVVNAGAAARALLEAPHPLVAAATAVWHRPGLDVGALDRWRATLPGTTGTGPLPEQAALDDWAREHTLGLIDQFPVSVTSETLLLLASALATRISWQDPFDVTAAGDLGPASPWAARLRRILRSPERGHQCWIAGSRRAGDVAVHTASSGQVATADGQAGLVVVSVAATPDVVPVDVLATAYELATAAVHAPDGEEPRGKRRHKAALAGGRRSLFDLPLGDTALWTLREEPTVTYAPDGREERIRAVLPCWSAESRIELTEDTLGFPVATWAFGELLDTPELAAEVVQKAVARYSRYGFEAAAVTGWAMATSMPPEGVARIAELRFGHPYAVVAVATETRSDGTAGPWHGVPVFSAWVAEPDELPEADLADRYE